MLTQSLCLTFAVAAAGPSEPPRGNWHRGDARLERDMSWMHTAELFPCAALVREGFWH